MFDEYDEASLEMVSRTRMSACLPPFFYRQRLSCQSNRGMATHRKKFHSWRWTLMEKSCRMIGICE